MLEYLDTAGRILRQSANRCRAQPTAAAATATLTGLGHLEGQIVQILGNGAVYASQPVVSGQVTGLNPKVTQAEVGLHSHLVAHHAPKLEEMRATGAGARKRWNSIVVRLNDSIASRLTESELSFGVYRSDGWRPCP